MKRIIFILAALFATAQSQTIQTIGAPTTTVVSRGNFRTDSIFYLPKRQKLPTDSGAVRYQISDSSVYYWSGFQWLKLGVNIDTASMLSTYVRGSGTANYLPKFNASRSIVDSKVYETGTNLMFNTTTPYFTTSGIGSFDINGSTASVLVLRKTDTARGYWSHNGSTMDINNIAAGDMRFYTNAQLRGRFQTDGTFRLNSLTGTGSRIVTADADGVLSATSSATGLVDTLVLSTRAWRQKGDDSLGAIIATKGTGTVTSVATGYGLSGGTITTTGTISADTALIASRLRVGKVVDSLALVKQNVLTNPVTGTGTSGQIAYFNGTSTITGENALFWDATNDRLGIGTNSIINADAKFDAVSSTNIRPRIRSTSASVAYLYLQNSSTGTGDGDGLTVGVVGTGAAIINNREATSLTIYTSDLERVFIASGGNVGIGTTNPTGFQSRILNLYGSTGTELHLTSSGSGTSSSDGFTLELRDSDGQAHLNLRENNAIAIATNDIARGYISASGEWILNGSLTDAGDYKLQVSGNAYVTGTTVLAASSGNVGIGDASPKQRLDVFGAGGGGGKIALTNVNTTNYNELIFYENTTVKATIFQNGSAQSNFGGNNSLNIYQASNAPITFYTNGSNQRGQFSGDGELLLNTTTDAGDYKLQVSGNAYVTGTTVLAATSGNVGIGSTTANAKLHVTNGSAYVTAATSQSVFLRLYANAQTSNQLEIGQGFASTTDNIGYIFNTANAALIFGTNYIDRGRFEADGDLVIGGTSASASAIVDITSTTKGFLPPRMTTTQRDAISSPAAGLVIYNTTTSKLQVYTTAWTDLH